MKSGLTTTESSNRETRVCPVSELPRDITRMLRVQWKELINCIEDVEFEQGLSDTNDSKPKVWAHRLLTRALNEEHTHHNHFHKAS